MSCFIILVVCSFWHFENKALIPLLDFVDFSDQRQPVRTRIPVPCSLTKTYCLCHNSPLDTPHLASQSWDLFHHESKKSVFEYKTLCLKIWLNHFPGLLSHSRCPMTWVLCHNYGACQGWQEQGKQFWVGSIIVYAQSAQVTIVAFATIFTSMTYQFYLKIVTTVMVVVCDICHKSKVTYCVRVDRLKGSNFEWREH